MPGIHQNIRNTYLLIQSKYFNLLDACETEEQVRRVRASYQVSRDLANTSTTQELINNRSRIEEINRDIESNNTIIKTYLDELNNIEKTTRLITATVQLATSVFALA